MSYPSSNDWMTEAEEVAWINTLGFSCTVADLQASYASFKYTPVDPATNVLWGTESDELRNYYRLAKRTGHAPFQQQAQSWHDFMVNIYSNWQTGGSNVIEPEHVYLMGLVDWYADNKDQPTLDAINRIIDFILQKISSNPFYETRVSARCIMGLARYMEKIGTRASEVQPKLLDFVAGVRAAQLASGFVSLKFYVGAETVGDLPAGEDLRTLFPKNTAKGFVTSANGYQLQGFHGCGVYQDCMLFHALRVAARVLADPTLDDVALANQKAWTPLIGHSFSDPQGTRTCLLCPYYILTDADPTEMNMFLYEGSSSQLLYTTQLSAYCTDDALRAKLQQQALVRQYGQFAPIAAGELGGKPRYFPWQTWEEGYFLTQK